MPVKIVDDQIGQTSVSFGEVTLSDLAIIKSEFLNFAEINTSSDRAKAINKRVSFFFSKQQFIELFNSTPEYLGVKLTIGVQKEPTFDLCGNNESNNMCIVVETYLNKDNKIPSNTPGSFVLINGYQNNGTIKIADNDGCCPSSDPPTTGNKIIGK